jgi:hypothetical protein
MITAKHCKEVSLWLTNDIGGLSKLTKIISEKGINILAACAWVEDENIHWNRPHYLIPPSAPPGPESTVRQ